ncbi:SPOR domain-containing protein [Noviherbaspirillum sp. UKPF54]|uniref:SPOR domain-containing protein n=1 Tax=Noviherbaspirillum sp. UKPF54 TaxID=2601898 RepID=UPI0011B19B09|nr:SPOR domain-containing protein [Noviherbaspirillum sp. UKPF54]QDZ29171.1 SPOR domain-containing protein [Noviherbaspirillum sp. UKPF54]
MLKFFFWLLVLANAALFSYQRGYLDWWLPSGREPARLANQLNADKIKLASAPSAAPGTAAAGAASSAASSVAPVAPAEPATPAQAAPAPVTAPAAVPAAVANAAPAAPAPPPPEKKKPAMIACTEFGNFNAEDAKRVSAQLTALAIGSRIEQRPVREVTSHIVYIPPQADREAAEKKAEELRGLGVSDIFIIQDNSSLRWGISLGVFKTEEAARTHLANLNQKGVRSARIGERSVNLVALQVRDMEADKKAALERFKARYPKQDIRRCEPA